MEEECVAICCRFLVGLLYCFREHLQIMLVSQCQLSIHSTLPEDIFGPISINLAWKLQIIIQKADSLWQLLGVSVLT